MLDLTALLKYADENHASDVHIAVGVSPKIRVHGRLQSTNFQKMSASDTLEVLLAIITPHQRERFEKDGEIDISVSISGAGRYRVNAYKQRGSITLAFRLVDMQIPDPADLAIPESVLNLCQKRRGLIIVSGPSGSGKSTVLASMIDQINESRDANIITLEDPIEYLHQHKRSIVNQREIGLDTKSTLKGLDSALKEDPDVIQIGTLDDYNVARKVFMASQTGRLIFSTMYTSSVVDTIEAIVALFPPYDQEQARHQLANSIRAVITRQLCDTADGTGRVPAYGIMVADNQIRNLIKKGEYDAIESVMKESSDKGMITMDESLYELFEKGIISRNTAISNASDQEDMEGRTLR